jgi:hypothetical protein
MYPVGTTAITAGMLVTLNAAGLAIPAPVATDPDVTALGIAGDSALTAQGQTTAYSAQVVLGADGANTRWTENRVSDFYNETTASDKITVYNGGGKFWISHDLCDGGAAAFVPGDLLGISAATAGEWARGMTNDDVVALCVGGVQDYPSGVPGTDIDGSITLGEYVPLVLRI